jgi:gamma-glutamyltranspeptidase/glutathione hydrolase
VVGSVRGFMGGAVADEPRAARIAADMLSAGGTAADAAVALYFGLTVTLPSTASLGGGGVCVVYDANLNQTQVLDFSPRAPAAGGAIALPAAARGMAALHAQYGKLRWEQVVSPAESLARFGYPVSRAFAADVLAARPIIENDPELRRLFLRDGVPYAEGQTLVQQDLSTVLSAIRNRGAGELYNGFFARQFLSGAAAHGATFTLDELRATYFAWRPAARAQYDDIALFFPASPNVAGLLEAQLWNMTAPRWQRASADERPHLFAQASLRAWIDRTRWLGPDLTVSTSPLELAGDQRINALMSTYRPDQKTPAAGLQSRNEPIADDAAASSFVVVDRTGSAVSCSVTAYGLFGAGHVAAGTGIVLAATPDGGAHGPQWLGPMLAIRQGERRFFTFGKNATFAQQTEGSQTAGSQFVFGAAASGGASASSALLEVALRAMVEKRPLQAAVDAQRLHYEGAPAETVFVESGVQARLPGLVERGYTLVPVPVIGRVNAIQCPGGIVDTPATCAFAADRRGFGLAASGN